MPRRDRTYNDGDLVRFYHRNLTPFEKDSVYNQLCKVNCGGLPLMVDEALDYLVEVRGNPAIKVLEDILDLISKDPDLPDDQASNTGFQNASIPKIPPVVRWALLLWKLLSIKGFLKELINLLDPTIETLREVEKILDQVCKKQEENGQE